MEKIVSVIVILVIGVCLNGVIANSPTPIVTPGDDPSIAPQNLCNYFAADSDLTNAGIMSAIADFCTNNLGVKPNGVNVNVDDNPYKMCLMAGDATFGNLKPLTGQQTIARDFFNNTSNQVINHSFTLSGAFTQSISVATTNTITLSVSVDYSVSIPDALSSKFTVSTSFTSSKTTTNTATSSINYTPGFSAACDPRCAYTATESVDVAIYKSDMIVPICMSGYARCNYNNPVKGHYLWYVYIDSFLNANERCFIQQGSLSSAISDINSSTTVFKQCY